MNDHHVNDEWSDHEQWQPDMPPTDEAWHKMLAKLEEEMPGGPAVKNAGKKKAWRNKLIYALVLLLLLVSVVYVKDHMYTSTAKPGIRDALPANTITDRQQPAANAGSTLQNISKVKEVSNNIVSNNGLIETFSAGKKKTLLTTALPAFQKEQNGFHVKTKDAQDKDTLTTSAYNDIVALNDNIPTNQKEEPKKVQPADSSQHNNDDQEAQKLIVQAGLQWTASIPVTGTRNYFAGPPANMQPWRVLLPGVWVSVKGDKDMFLAEVNPFAAASFNPTSFYANTTIREQTSIDTIKSLSKVFGISAAVSYHHNIKNNWWIGGGLQTSFWKKGVAALTVKEHDNVTDITTSYTHNYAISKGDWHYFSKMQLYPHIQVMYYNSRYQAGLRTGATFTTLAKDDGPKNVVFTELFFRLPLISNNKK